MNFCIGNLLLGFVEPVRAVVTHTGNILEFGQLLDEAFLGFRRNAPCKKVVRSGDFIGGIANGYGHHHAHGKMRSAFDGIETFGIKGDLNFLVDCPLEDVGAFGDHPDDGLGIMALVGCQEFDGVTGRDLKEGRLKTMISPSSPRFSIWTS
jgi:hypothetical protein